MKTLAKGLLALFLVLAAAFPFLEISSDDKLVVLAATGELKIHFVNVGQADGCIVELPDGKTMLIDAGENSTASSGSLLTYIDNNTTIQSFDYAIMTHSDSDHIGGMKKILEPHPAKVVYRPNQAATYGGYTDPAYLASGKLGFWGAGVTGSVATKDTQAYYNAISTAYNTAEEVIVTNSTDSTQNQIVGTDYTFDFFSASSYMYSDNNDYSPIMVIEYAGRQIVMSGDAEAKNEQEFVSAVKSGNDSRLNATFNSEFNADILKLGHHGSETSSSEDYLLTVTPQKERRAGTYTVISCGENKSYGHPHLGTLTRLMDMDFCPERISRTDCNGNIVFTISANGQLTRTLQNSSTLSEILTSGLSNNAARPQTTVPPNSVQPPEGFDDGTNGNTPTPTPDPPTPEPPAPKPKEKSIIEQLFENIGLGLIDPTLQILILIAAAALLILAIVLLFVLKSSTKGKARRTQSKSNKRKKRTQKKRTY